VLRRVELDGEVPGDGYPFGLPAVRGLPLELSSHVTVLVGENGSGKSTLIEAIAVAAGFNPEGGSGQVRFETETSHSALADHVKLTWRPRLRLGWFLRSESFYNVATHRDRSPGVPMPSYHRMSHGESFLAVARDWFHEPALFVLDEPEAALSFQGQLALIAAVVAGVDNGAQFIIATHSPILMSTPGATIFELGEAGLTPRAYEELEVVGMWRALLADPQRFLRHLG
jgi:predicted ATPase